MDVTQQKLVSIGLPVYNGAPRMRKAVDSLLSQTYRNIELILADDCSTDETPHICKEYAAQDKRVRYIRQEKNLGHIDNVYFVLAQAAGEYFMLAADDDQWDAHFIADLLPWLEAHGEYGVAMSSYARVDDQGNGIDVISYSGDLDLTHQRYYRVFEKMVLRRPIHIFLYGIFRTEFLRRVFARPAPDVMFWDRVVMCEMALGTRFHSFAPVRFFKHIHGVSAKKRYKHQTVGSVYYIARPYSRYVGVLLWRLLTSPVIPLERKFLVFIPWCKITWSYRKSIWYEFFHHRPMGRDL